jgi:hypothetical protein
MTFCIGEKKLNGEFVLPRILLLYHLLLNNSVSLQLLVYAKYDLASFCAYLMGATHL